MGFCPGQGCFCVLVSLRVHLLFAVVSERLASTAGRPADSCDAEPWGRYSASGGLYTVAGSQFLYSFGGDTGSDQDGKGGVVVTNWRFSLRTRCWERLQNSPSAVGYRSTATLLDGSVYIFGGGDTSYAAIDHFWKYRLETDSWTQLSIKSGPSARYKHATAKISETKMLLLGGRAGRTVLSDSWLFDASTQGWAPIGANILQVYRHAMAYDPVRDVIWIMGGLDGSLDRYRSQLWRWDYKSTSGMVEVTYAGDHLPRMASHAMEYVRSFDALFAWGGTCSDSSQLYLFDIPSSRWCSLAPSNRPDRRDASLWALDFPKLYIAQGDLICHRGGIYPIADVHAFDFSEPDAWEVLYEPRNERGTGKEAYCDGSNKGHCQPAPLLGDRASGGSTCNADSTARWGINASGNASGTEHFSSGVAALGHSVSLAITMLALA